jgi:hypothetical protein
MSAIVLAIRNASLLPCFFLESFEGIVQIVEMDDGQSIFFVYGQAYCLENLSTFLNKDFDCGVIIGSSHFAVDVLEFPHSGEVAGDRSLQLKEVRVFEFGDEVNPGIEWVQRVVSHCLRGCWMVMFLVADFDFGVD